MSSGRSAASRWLRRLFWPLLVVIVILPLVLRISAEGRRELELAARAGELEDFELQVIHLGRAARWRLPGGHHQELALAQLMVIARAHDRRGSEGLETALSAYREVRRALFATRTFGVQSPELLHDANLAIARLMAEQELRFGYQGQPRSDREAMYLAQLQVEPPGLNGLSLVACGAFVLWLASFVAFARWAIAEDGRVRRVPALAVSVVGVLFAGVWFWATRYAQPDYIVADRSPAAIGPKISAGASSTDP